MLKKINLYALTEEQQTLFIEGWDAAGGYTADAEAGSPSPWCCPWDCGSAPDLETESDDPRDWGAQYWEMVKDEVFAEVEEDNRYRIEACEDAAREEMDEELGYAFDGFSDDDLQEGRSAAASFSRNGVSAYTRTENSASFATPETEKEWAELRDCLITQALDRAVFVVGSVSEARELFDAKFGAFV